MLDTNNLFVLSIVALSCAIEGVLSLSDLGILGPEHLRTIFYFNGAFWPGLLENWQPNYSVQPYTMFVSHVFLHTGFVHLAVNMIALWSLGRVVVRRVGQGTLMSIYGVSALGGGIGFALLADNLQPMVGASGALFGLLGAIVVWKLRDSRGNPEEIRDYFMIIGGLLVLNVIHWWAMDGQLAWEAHLGGLLAGCIVALFVDQARSGSETQP